LAKKAKEVIEVESDCVIDAVARKIRDNIVGALMFLKTDNLYDIFPEVA